MPDFFGTGQRATTAEGGVWGSYVQYLKDLEAAARKLVDAMEVEFGMMDTRSEYDDIDRAEDEVRSVLNGRP